MAIIREINDIQLEQIGSMEQLIFADAWSLESLRSTKGSNHGNIVASIDNVTKVIQGYLIYYCMGDEIELARIATSPDARGQGIGQCLMGYLEKEAIQSNMERILLEVRIGNRPAINLYEKCGYESIGIRKAYYLNPVEDGNIMEKVL